VLKFALMMEAARFSETLVNFYQTTRRNNPEDSHLRTHRRENLRSYLPFLFGAEQLETGFVWNYDFVFIQEVKHSYIKREI
jgi:hypothetical protein